MRAKYFLNEFEDEDDFDYNDDFDEREMRRLETAIEKHLYRLVKTNKLHLAGNPKYDGFAVLEPLSPSIRRELKEIAEWTGTTLRINEMKSGAATECYFWYEDFDVVGSITFS